MHTVHTQSFAELLQSAVEEPGTLSAAYQQFHNYSLGNQLLAMFQCQERGLRPGPRSDQSSFFGGGLERYHCCEVIFLPAKRRSPRSRFMVRAELLPKVS